MPVTSSSTTDLSGTHDQAANAAEAVDADPEGGATDSRRGEGGLHKQHSPILRQTAAGSVKA